MAAVVNVDSLFDHLDTNKNGVISRAEFEEAIRSGAIPAPPTAAVAYGAPQQVYAVQQEQVYMQAPQVYAQPLSYGIPAGQQVVYAQEPQQFAYAAPAAYEQAPIIHTAEPIYITAPASAAVATYAQAPVYEFQQAQAPVYEFQQMQAPVYEFQQAPVYEVAPQYAYYDAPVAAAGGLPPIITTAEPIYMTGPAPAEFAVPEACAAPQAYMAPQTYAVPQPYAAPPTYQPLPSVLAPAPSMYTYQSAPAVTTVVAPVTAASAKVKKVTKKRACGCC